MKIFVTAGTQLPFDRLLKAVDEWAGQNPNAKVTAQAAKDEYHCKHIRVEQFLSPLEFEGCVSEADLLIAHAGMGTILTAIELAIPLVIMPRQFQLSEHRNDHQASTAAKFCGYPGIYIVNSLAELTEVIGNSDSLVKPIKTKSFEKTQLIDYLQQQVIN
jgi:UDP-N-acetylglucosamine transferase subunit ALG13